MRKEESSLVHDIVIITIITLIAGLLLGVIHSITAGPIAAQEEKTRIRTQKAVFPAASSFKVVEGIADDEVLIEKVADTGLTKTEVCAVDIAYDEAGDKLGYVVTSLNKEGYGGEIKIMTGIDTTGEELSINGIAFLTLAETAGMGMKADLPEFKDQFVDLVPGDLVPVRKESALPSLDYFQSTDEIDAISGSTITTSSVMKAANAALVAARYLEGGAS